MCSNKGSSKNLFNGNKNIQEKISNEINTLAEVEDCSEEIKEKCLSWLQDICLLKKGIKGLNEKLPRVCRNGLIFIDIVNRI